MQKVECSFVERMIVIFVTVKVALSCLIWCSMGKEDRTRCLSGENLHICNNTQRRSVKNLNSEYMIYRDAEFKINS